MFDFERVAGDRTQVHYTVRADLALSRKYGILVQELPLLCKLLLERHDVDAASGGPSITTLTEGEMRTHADDRAAARSAARRRPPRRPSSANLGAAWRAPHGAFSTVPPGTQAAGVKPVR